jgi:tripartite-type tricarboxylate transporter receptor subunit TctC
MNIPRIRRQVLACCALIAATGLFQSNPVLAQVSNFPSKPIKILVPFTAGSGADVYARFFGKKLSEILGQPVIVENKPGAGGALAVQSLKNDPADGYTMLMGSNSPMAVNVVTVKNLTYDPVADLRPVAGMTRSMAVFMVPNASPLKTIGDLEKRGRQLPALNSGTYSPGYQLAAAQFTSKAGTPFQTVMYKGLSQTITDVMGNQIDLAVIDSTGSVSTATSGKARIILVTGDKRHPELPDVPTLKESGYPEAVHYSWTSFWVSSKTPDPIVKILADAMQKALAQPDSKEFIEQTGAEVMPFGPTEMRAFQLTEIERFRKAATDSGFKAED